MCKVVPDTDMNFNLTLLHSEGDIFEDSHDSNSDNARHGAVTIEPIRILGKSHQSTACMGCSESIGTMEAS